MDVCRIIILSLSFCLISLAVTAGELSQCLFAAGNQQHRIEKENAVRLCFTRYKDFINKDTCYLFLAQKVSKLSSTKLNEDISAICFYETTPAKDLKACLLESKKFKSSGNHDEAVFYCYQQFQNLITQKDCLNAAEQMIYPFKKQYLQQQCLTYN